MQLKITAPELKIIGSITLEGSKSISNRLLIMRALSGNEFKINYLSPSEDTTTLNRLLHTNDLICDVGAAGTTMRFLTAYFSIGEGEKILTGTERMKNRPIKILVDALREIGAEIHYLEKDGYPPIRIMGRNIIGGNVKMPADVSSQYISALLMIAPQFQNGLILELTGIISSRPYINMTLRLMHMLGIEYNFKGNIISVLPGKYRSKEMDVEGDWSAASYYYSIAALAKKSRIRIQGLLGKSLQGDSVLPHIYKNLGVESFFENGEYILHHGHEHVSEFEYDFSDCPDLAQTVIVTCAALGIHGKFRGLESLRIKETDRTAALSTELKKLNVEFVEEGKFWSLSGSTSTHKINVVQTYEDHRMAMAFAPLALKHGAIIIEDPFVVKKSYPSFWSDLSSLGFGTGVS